MDSFRGFSEETFRFLRALERHNRRDWFNDRKQVYLTEVRGPMEALVSTIGERLGRIAPEFVADPATSVYRIYRDTRFSHDKSPYKTHVAAVFPHRDLGKHQGAGFYVHVAPDDVFAGGGLYRPDRADLTSVRRKLGADHRRFRRLISTPRFRETFGELSGEQLVRVPSGFPADHPAADLLRYKQFLAGRQFEPEIALTPDFAAELVGTFRALLPVCRFLNDAILGDRPGIDIRKPDLWNRSG